MKTAFILLAFAVSQVAAAANWELAMFTGDSEEAGAAHLKCHYKANSGYEFSIIVKGMCPGFVYVNPETGEVREKG